MVISIEYTTIQWIEKWAQTKIEDWHLMIEAPGLGENNTNIIRGHIQCARRALEDAKREFDTSGRV